MGKLHENPVSRPGIRAAPYYFAVRNPAGNGVAAHENGKRIHRLQTREIMLKPEPEPIQNPVMMEHKFLAQAAQFRPVSLDAGVRF
jgi:hypothetical protein